jgi:hypothetical protein
MPTSGVLARARRRDLLIALQELGGHLDPLQLESRYRRGADGAPDRARRRRCRRSLHGVAAGRRIRNRAAGLRRRRLTLRCNSRSRRARCELSRRRRLNIEGRRNEDCRCDHSNGAPRSHLRSPLVFDDMLGGRRAVRSPLQSRRLRRARIHPRKKARAQQLRAHN